MADIEAVDNADPLQVWRLLLEQWQPLDTAVVCKLLCVSQNIAGPVHSLCAGRLCVTIEHIGRAGGGQYLAPPEWLARNALLMESCSLGSELPREGCSLQLLAAGLAAASAAAASPAAGDSPTIGQQLAASASVSASWLAALKTAAESGNSSSSRPSQGLLLKRFESKIPTSGHLLCAIAGSTQLTQLKLELTDTPTPPGVTAALASLTSLKDVTITFKHPLHPHQLQHQFDSAAAAFSHLQAALTALDIGEFGCNTSAWPPSLQRVRCSDGADATNIHMGHLQHLTRLDLTLTVGGLLPADRLPLGLRELVLALDRSIMLEGEQLEGDLEPLVRMESLTRLELSSRRFTLGDKLHVLPRLAALKDLSLALSNVSLELEEEMLQTARHLSAAPLKSLVVRMSRLPQPFVGVLGTYTQLTYLKLATAWVPNDPDPDPVEQLAAQLSRMSALRELVAIELMAGNVGDGEDQQEELVEGAGWEPLTAALCGLPALRSVTMAGTPLGAAAARLAAATQLTRLMLGECDLDGDVVSAVAAGLAAHVSAQHLKVMVNGEQQGLLLRLRGPW